eukprot:TRINITY_DN31173_c0_g1_i1.p1 TRINITY_DN31173_c0_g1~~TRINITY_DN31173_c0_g1_i1.p1  ORF type:complete len:357 (-),score=92.69 TRINITY_DN31173_c0_g1_i1:19-1089(-)
MAEQEEFQNNGGLLYHEAQESKLCAVHCVNTLLQGPLFTEFDLATIASDLDRKEELMMMEGHSYGLRTEESANVSMDGNFSIQVLERALNIWDLSVIPFDSPAAEQARLEPQNEEAFICHLEDHWFCIRKIDGEWYDFNSLYPAPQHLSKFYLAAFLDTLRCAGWSIFLVRGKFPKCLSCEGSNRFGQWLTPEDAKRITKSTAMTVSHDQVCPLGSSSSGTIRDPLPATEEAQLKAVIAASLGAEKSIGRSFDSVEEVDEDLNAAIAASLRDSCPTDSTEADTPNKAKESSLSPKDVNHDLPLEKVDKENRSSPDMRSSRSEAPVNAGSNESVGFELTEGKDKMAAPEQENDGTSA